MAQTTANPSGTLGLRSAHRRAVAAAVGVAAALAFTALVMTGPSGTLTSGADDTVAPATAIREVDDFVARRYLSNPASSDDSWKDDHITRRYLPGS